MAAPRLASGLAASGDLWEDPAPDHAAILGILGGGVPVDRADAARGLVNTAQRSPVALAFVVAGDCDYIHVGHTPTFYPARPGDPTVFDDHVAVLVGDNFDTAVPVVLPDVAFARPAAVRCFNMESITGANGHTAAPPVYRHGPHAAGTDGTSDVRIRNVFVLPAALTDAALATQQSGRYTLLQFYATFLQADLASADPNVVAAAIPLRDWYRAASTDTAGGNTVPAVDPITSNAPVVNQALNAWITGVKNRELAKLGLGGPGLTTAAFQAGVQDLRTQMQQDVDAQLAFQRDRDEKTFTDKHGEALAEQLHRLCGSVDDDGLADVHKLLAKNTNKSRDYAIVKSLILRRVADSVVPLTAASAPIASPKLVDEVFRCLQPASTGQTFAQGLTPFAIICEGHPEMDAVRSLTRKAVIAEQGNALTLADAEAITSTDVRFPTDAVTAAEKCYGWSILVDIFHKPTEAIAANVRAAVLEIGPALPRVHQQAGASSVGLDYVNRILYELQQEYFTWVTKTANGDVVPEPTFHEVRTKVLTYRAASLSPLPASWYTMLGAPSGTSVPSRQEARTPRQVSGSVATVNAHPDRGLLTRFRDCEHSTIAAMMDGKNAEIPKYRGKDVCLTWALKGSCSTNCKRADQHVRYPAAVNTALHGMLTTCGVANPQE